MILFLGTIIWILDRAKVPIGTVMYHMVKRPYPAMNRLINGVLKVPIGTAPSKIQT